ncbi:MULTISPECIES: hypothetical protein [Enterobacter]|uniref:hypothetical protein n=1 Tax=Enterobacter TaxID=547 RepID=UPI0010A40F54|nr:hypothetical protein [Enterobacter bugandensis]QCE29038.1 hypothetical protein FAI37_17155 [Enterobacter bugandensis]
MEDDKKSKISNETKKNSCFEEFLTKQDLSRGEFALIIATALCILFTFGSTIFHFSLLGTNFGNKCVIGALTIYVTIMFIMTDLIPSSSPSKKWFSISCRTLSIGIVILSLTFFV